MENSLLLYLNKRLNQEHLAEKKQKAPGPVLTISRETGCGALKIARKLAVKLNQPNDKWKVLSKEIFEESARELEMNQDKIKKIMSAENRNTFDEILAALSSKRYKSELKIRKTVVKAIHSLADDGYCILVGRGSHLITKDISHSLHIRLTAPLGWRIAQVAQNHRLSEEKAREFIIKTEKERENFRKHIIPDAEHNDQFDLIIRMTNFSEDQIVDILFNAMKSKGLAE